MESTFDGGNTVPWYEHAPEHEDVYWPISWYFHCMQEQDILVNYDDHAGIMWHERWLRWQCSKLEGLINWCTSQARISSHHYEATALHWHHYSGRLSSTKWNALILRLNNYTPTQPITWRYCCQAKLGTAGAAFNASYARISMFETGKQAKSDRLRQRRHATQTKAKCSDC